MGRLGSSSLRALVMVLCSVAPSCSALSCETPLEREERELKAAGESMEAVVYRGIKVSLRSAPIAAGEPEGTDAGVLLRQWARTSASSPTEAALGSDAAAAKVREQTQRLFAAMVTSDESESRALTAADYVKLATAFYSLRHSLRDVDEDDLPTLFEVLSHVKAEQGDPLVLHTLTWYNSAWEHLAIAVVCTVSKAPRGMVIYELGQLDPSQLQMTSVRLMSRLLRGITFSDYGWPYLAERELTAYLKDLEDNREEMVRFSREFQQPSDWSDAQLHAQWHAAGVLTRGLVRLEMGEESDAGMLDDLDAFLADARTLGIDAEGVWLVDAYVGIKREDAPRAITSLERLAQSPMFPDTEQQLFRDAAEAMRARDPDAAFTSITDKALVAKVVLTYATTVLMRVDWKEKLQATESGKSLLRAQAVLSEELNRINQAASSKQLSELTTRAAEQSKGTWEQVRQLVSDWVGE